MRAASVLLSAAIDRAGDVADSSFLERSQFDVSPAVSQSPPGIIRITKRCCGRRMNNSLLGNRPPPHRCALPGGYKTRGPKRRRQCREISLPTQYQIYSQDGQLFSFSILPHFFGILEQPPLRPTHHDINEK